MTSKMKCVIAKIETMPTIEPKTKAIAEVTFDDDKLREIVHEAVERIKEEYDIVDNPEAVSVVRCKECKHKYQEPWDNGVAVEGECEIWHNATLDDDYCSYGEREGE